MLTWKERSMKFPLWPFVSRIYHHHHRQFSHDTYVYNMWHQSIGDRLCFCCFHLNSQWSLFRVNSNFSAEKNKWTPKMENKIQRRYLRVESGKRKEKLTSNGQCISCRPISCAINMFVRNRTEWNELTNEWNGKLVTHTFLLGSLYRKNMFRMLRTSSARIGHTHTHQRTVNWNIVCIPNTI